VTLGDILAKRTDFCMKFYGMLRNKIVTLPLSFVEVILQVAQLSQRDRAAGWVSFGQK